MERERRWMSLADDPADQRYLHDVVKTDYVCPYCGARDMWQAVHAVDRWLGSPTRCGTCQRMTHNLDEVGVDAGGGG